MSDRKQLELALTSALGLTRRPIAILFRDNPPAGVQPFTGTVPSGCSFWRLAAEGRTFYTVPSDHYSCPIGSYTHNIPTPEERQPELSGTLQLMTDIGYLRMEEVPGIPRLPKTPGAVVYAPLAESPEDPDVVVLAGRPGQIMLLVETANRAGVPYDMPMLARPTCMAIPASLASGLITSAGCIGNRTYTNIGDDEIYAVFRGQDLAGIAAELDTIAQANAKLREYHEARQVELLRV
jgi:uncharacterized protein (DUF169 family)